MGVRRAPREAEPMDEPQWLACTDPEVLLRLLPGRVSARKLRLFACACVRTVEHLLKHQRSRQALHVAGRFADGQASEGDLDAARQAARNAAREAEQRVPPASQPYIVNSARRLALVATVEAARAAADAAWVPARHSAVDFAVRVAVQARDALFYEQVAATGGCGETGLVYAYENERPALEQAQCLLLRDIVGNPFRPVVVEPRWLAWEGGTVVRLARSIYEAKAFERLPYLGDALEEAGCDREEVLGHCRSEGPHVRGCHILDLILAKDR
jgi:hypothetical protein